MPETNISYLLKKVSENRHPMQFYRESDPEESEWRSSPEFMEEEEEEEEEEDND